jgi:hypothetical protein
MLKRARVTPSDGQELDAVIDANRREGEER